MTKRVQILGHEAEVANAFIGEEREITVDTDNWELRLHDGSTPGGWKILNRNQNDARYQARSVELDGLLGWEPNERGIVTRLGPANYQLRSILVDEDNLAITDGNGYAGDPTIALAPTIQSDHEVTGSWEFTQSIVATGGVAGNLTGNVTGNLTGNVTGNVTGNLTGNVVGDVTGDLTGGFDTRGSTIIMDNGQINPAWIAGLAGLIAQSGIPIGGIIPFYGEIADIPGNWSICDGTSGTPNLSDRFIVGAGTVFPNGAVGGSIAHSHSVAITESGTHTHVVAIAGTALTIEQMPSHKHANGVTNTDDGLFSRGTTAAAVTTPESIDDNGSNGTLEGWSETVGGGATHSHSATIETGGAHGHSGATSDSAAIPPYYAMIYIMRSS